MKELLAYMSTIEDRRQEKKVRHKLNDVVGLTFFAMLGNANESTEIEVFGKEHEELLRNYLDLGGGIPSHDTLQRVMAIIAPEQLQTLHVLWKELMNSDEGEKIKKLLSLDGKTQRGNRNTQRQGNHIVSAVDEEGFCLGEALVDKKSNEITAIPELLNNLNVKGNIITTDAMGCQKEIAKLIRKKRADYVLALKKNHGDLHEDVQVFFSDPEAIAKCGYWSTVEKARGGIEKREYWQTDDISWLPGRSAWAGLKSIAMTRNTIQKGDKTTTETRYFISSLPLEVKEVARAIRGHWMVESYHWHLDVTFGEDKNRTLDKQAAFNLNILRKLALNVLKLFDAGKAAKSLKLKRFAISTNPLKHLERLMAL